MTNTKQKRKVSGFDIADRYYTFESMAKKYSIELSDMEKMLTIHPSVEIVEYDGQNYIGNDFMVICRKILEEGLTKNRFYGLKDYLKEKEIDNTMKRLESFIEKDSLPLDVVNQIFNTFNELLELLDGLNIIKLIEVNNEKAIDFNQLFTNLLNVPDSNKRSIVLNMIKENSESLHHYKTFGVVRMKNGCCRVVAPRLDGSPFDFDYLNGKLQLFKK